MTSVLVSGVSGLQVDLKEPTPPPVWIDSEVGTDEVRKVVKDVKRTSPLSGNPFGALPRGGLTLTLYPFVVIFL